MFSVTCNVNVVDDKANRDSSGQKVPCPILNVLPLYLLKRDIFG